MERKRRGTVIGALLLILLGVWWLAAQLFPELRIWESLSFEWPLIVIAVGVVILIIGLLSGQPDMAVPAVIVGGIGCLLYYQNSTGDWASWAYAWALIPGFAGLGTILAGLLGGDLRRGLRDGFGLLLISAILFLIFGSLLGGLDLLGPYWPLLIILAGVWVLIETLWRRRSAR
ncbi:MAG: conserved rane protein of unknown function [Chloroflexi bacterium]|jgi:peptidoglycan/LPS O-acetylase OafA/YrhL|nr:conserved rane protein of unknown function [Chloroflexota bacterium]